MNVRPKVGKETLRQVCEKLGLPEPRWKDEYYELFPSIDEFTRHYATPIFHRIAEFIPRGYEPGCSDCDKFALVAVVEVQRIYRARPDRIKGCAAAFGSTDINAGEELAHDLNLLFFWAGPNNTVEDVGLAFFEPQRSQFTLVTKDRYQNAFCYV